MRALVLILALGIVATFASGGGIKQPMPTWGDKDCADPSRLFPTEKRMLNIKLPVIDFRQANVSDIFDCLDGMVKQHGSVQEKSDRTRVRIKFAGSEFHPRLDDDCPILLTFGSRDIPLYHALQVCCELGQMEYRIDGNTVIVTHRDLDTQKMDIELRMSDKSSPLPDAKHTKLALFHSRGSECRFPPKQKEDTLTQSVLISRESRRALVVAFSNKPAPVFELPIPEVPKPQSWSEWQPPAYFASTNMWLMNQSSDFPVMIDETNNTHLISKPHLELRYRIESWKKKKTKQHKGA